MMRKILLLLLLANTAFAAVSIGLGVSTLQVPASVEPGTDFSVQLQAYNRGGAELTDMKIYPALRAPFSITPGTDSTFEVGKLSEGQTTMAPFRLRLADGVSSGTYNITFKVDYSNPIGTARKDKQVSIIVDARPDLEILSSQTNTDAYPGSFVKLTLTLKNIGGGKARNVRVEYTNFTSIHPVGSSIVLIPEIGAGQTAEATVDLSVDGKAEGGAYPLVFKLSFDDESGAAQASLSRKVGLPVQSNILLQAFLDKAEPVAAGFPGTVTVTIANMGSDTAKYVEVYASSSSFTLSPASTYIGNIESDDFDTIDVTAAPTAAPGTHPLKLSIKYRDQYNQPHELEEIIDLTVLTSSEAKKLRGGSSKLPYIVILLVVAGVWWYWRRRKRARAA